MVNGANHPNDDEVIQTYRLELNIEFSRKFSNVSPVLFEDDKCIRFNQKRSNSLQAVSGTRSLQRTISDSGISILSRSLVASSSSSSKKASGNNVKDVSISRTTAGAKRAGVSVAEIDPDGGNQREVGGGMSQQHVQGNQPGADTKKRWKFVKKLFKTNKVASLDSVKERKSKSDRLLTEKSNEET